MSLLTTPFARRAGMALAAASLTTALAACGGGGSTAKAASTTTTAAAGTGNRNAFRQCMASHGITIPTRPANTPSSRPPDTATDNGGNGGTGGNGGGFGGRFLQPPPGVDPTAYQNALNACRSSLPTAGGGGANGAQFRTAFTAYVNCLRSHGITTGDPSQPQQALTNVDRNSAAFQAANQACGSLLPQRRGPGTTTTTA